VSAYQVTPQGQTFPLGPSIHPDGINFAVVSEDASQLYLCLFDEHNQELESIPFIAKHRGIWHMLVCWG